MKKEISLDIKDVPYREECKECLLFQFLIRLYIKGGLEDKLEEFENSRIRYLK